MIQNVPGKWSFLEGIGGLVGQYGQLRQQQRDKQKGEAVNAADRLFRLAQEGTLPDTLDGNAVESLQQAGIAPETVLAVSRRRKAEQEQRDALHKLTIQREQTAIEENVAQADAARALARARGEVKPTAASAVAAENAAMPFAMDSTLTFEDAVPRMTGLKEFEGTTKDQMRVFYNAAKEKLRKDAERHQPKTGGVGGGKPVPLNTQLLYWGRLTKSSVDAAMRQVMTNEQLKALPEDQQDSHILSTAIAIVNGQQDARIPEQFSKGLGLAHFQAALAAARKAQRAEQRSVDASKRAADKAKGGASDIKSQIKALGGERTETATPPAKGGAPANPEATMSDADLWEKKVSEGMTPAAATSYVRARKRTP